MRQKKSQQVDEVRDDQRGVVIPIYYNPNKDAHYHHAEVGGERCQNADINEVKKWVRQQIRNMAEMVWDRVIEVRRYDVAKHTLAPALCVTIDRYYVARKIDKRWRKSAWDVELGRRLDLSHDWTFTSQDAKSDFNPPHTRVSGFDSCTYHYFAYSEELWLGLTRLVEGILKARQQLDELLGTPAGVERIATAGASLLHLLPLAADSQGRWTCPNCSTENNDPAAAIESSCGCGAAVMLAPVEADGHRDAFLISEAV